VRYIRFVATFIPLFSAAILHAQTPVAHPDFSGIWTIDAAKTQAINPTAPQRAGKPAPPGLNTDAVKPGTGRLETPAQPTVSAGETFTLRQTDTALVRESQGPNGLLSVTYAFDTSRALEANGLHPVRAQVEVHWTDAGLAIATTQDRAATRVTSTTTYARDGAWLAVTTTQAAMADRNGKTSPSRSQTIYYKAVAR
jgi:hypothetical protein